MSANRLRGVENSPLDPFDTLRSQLKTLGWSIYEQEKRSNLISWYACAQPGLGRYCESNKRPPQFVIQPFRFDTVGSVEMSVCGEVAGVWWEIKSYGMGPTEILERMATVSASLLAAWDALA